MRSQTTLCLLIGQWLGCQNVSAQQAPGRSFQVPARFPAGVFQSYYRRASPSQNPQPAIKDPVLGSVYPLNLTDPDTIPTLVTTDPVALPTAVGRVKPANRDKFINEKVQQIREIIDGNGIQGNCSKCIASLNVLQSIAQVAPANTSDVLVSLCKEYGFKSDSSCEESFGFYTFGSVWTQDISLGDVSGLDGRYQCYYLDSTFCPKPKQEPKLNTKGLFPKPKPKNPKTPKPSGKRVKVLHLSDVHLDPRYAVGAEANCSDSLCCRANNPNTDLPQGQISLKAPLYGSFDCDTPYFLATGAFQAIHPLTGTDKKGSNLAFTLYTGDLVSHESQEELSRTYVEYEETSIYSMLHYFLRGPVFATLGNHDTNPEAIDAPHALPGPLGQQLSWDFNHVAGLWQNYGWLSPDAAKEARLHYGGYSVKTPIGLRIISFNTDFWYHSNFLNFINTTNPDYSGQFKWMINELQMAEDAGERVWIIGHVLSGWDGSNPTPNPTDLFYQIVERYSPHVIANIFFGHTHEDQIAVFYANNGTHRNDPNPSTAQPLALSWIGPSVTPLTNLNSGFRMYEIDTATFEVFDSYTWYTDVDAFSTLDVAKYGPTFEFEYSAREAYGKAIGWPSNAPLNATFWHKVTVAMETEKAPFPLTQKFNTFQGKTSVKSPQCNTAACQKAKVCYIRSGSNPLGQECPQGYGSVQSAFNPSS